MEDDAVLPNEDEDIDACGTGVAENCELSVLEEETRQIKEPPRPTAPTQAEIDKHRIDHLPYRN